MAYTKVFSGSRFQTKAQPALWIDSKTKAVVIGARSGPDRRTAFLGKVAEQGKVSNILNYDILCDVTFPHVIGIFGSRGSGKSFDLGVLLEGIFLTPDLRQCAETRDAAIVFDVQDQFWTLGYAPSEEIEADKLHLSQLKRWGLEPTAIRELQVFSPASGDTQVPNAHSFSLAPEQLSTDDWLAILELDRFSAMGQALVTMLTTHGPLTPQDLSAAIASNPPAAFQQATVDGLLWRLEGLQDSQIIGGSGVSIDEFLRPGRLSVVLMRTLPDSIRGLVVGVITRLAADRMGRVQQARKVAMRTGGGAVDVGDLTGRLWTVLDEAHVLVPSDGTTPATGPLIDYVKRGRDAGLSLVFATQQPSAVNSKLMSQVDITVTHMLGFDSDLSAAVARMPTRTAVDYDVDNQKAGSIADVLRSLAPGEAIIADGASGRVFIANIRPRVTAHGGVTPK